MIKEHITQHLDIMVREGSEGFDCVFDFLQAPDKERYKPLLIYVDKILQALLENTDDIGYAHLHLEGLPENGMAIIEEFVAIKFFHLSSLVGPPRDYIEQEAAKLANIVKNKYVEVPDYYSGRQNKRKTKKYREEKEATVARSNFYNTIIRQYGKNASFLPRTIITLLGRDYDNLLEKFKARPFALPIEALGTQEATTFLNVEFDWKKVDGLKLPDGGYLTDEIENFVILGSEGKRASKTFTYGELKQYHSGKRKNLIVLSSSKERHGFFSLRSKLERIQANYHSLPKFPDYQAYPILKNEIEHLLTNDVSASPAIEFFGDENCSFWEEFTALIDIYEGLYELRSHKMMNIYSVVVNVGIKNIILDSIFGPDSPSRARILTDETLDTLADLSAESIAKIRAALSSVLSFIIQMGWREYLITKVGSKSILLLPEAVRTNTRLASHVKDALSIASVRNLHSWHSVNLDEQKNSAVIIDYRDAGKFPYPLKPNIIELPTHGAEITCHFINFFFKSKFDWFRYKYSMDLLTMLDHGIRAKHFQVGTLINQLKKQKPPRAEITTWDIDNQYEATRLGEMIRIKFDSTKTKSYTPSELFIVRFGDAPKLSVARLVDLINEEEEYDVMSLQALDEIYSEFNIYEKIANKDREARELKVLKEHYGLADAEKPEHLWKLLLKRKILEMPLADLYMHLQGYLREHGADLVSMGTFKDHWLEAESDTLIPRQKKAFFYLCEYLKLPKVYFTIMVRLKNMEVQNSRKSSKQMNALLSDLIHAGCFDENAQAIDQILLQQKDRLQERHDLGEIGFFDDTIVQDLQTLVALLKPSVRVEKIKHIDFN